MRIGIDYTAAVRQGAGIGRYTRQLVHALVELDVQNEYILLMAGLGTKMTKPQIPMPKSPVGHSSFGRCSFDIAPHVHTVSLPVSDRALAILWYRLRLPLWVELFSGRLDIFHSPDFALPPVRRARTVLTVHDLSFMRVPQCFPRRLCTYLRQVVPASVRCADVVLADSECTKDDIIELLGVDPDYVVVIHPGVDQRFKRVGDASVLQAVRSRYQLPARFVLSLGTLQPRKNFVHLIEAYARVREKCGNEIKLVIAGGAGWMYESIFQRVTELGLQDAVYFPGYVADEDLPALYTLADLFAFPSLYEGFGLPPLEAMACETPVVASNVSSLPEVIGDAALMVDPLDVTALAEAMLRVLTDPSLRGELVRRGMIRAGNFTWSRAAEKLLDVYRTI